MSHAFNLVHEEELCNNKPHKGNKLLPLRIVDLKLVILFLIDEIDLFRDYSITLIKL